MKKRKIIYCFVFSLLTLHQINTISIINKKEKKIEILIKIKEEMINNYNNKKIENEKLLSNNKSLLLQNKELKNNINSLNKINQELKEKNNKLKNQYKKQQNYIEKKGIISYYTNLQDEGGGLGITASGKKLSNTSIAIPRNDDLLKFGIEIEFENLAPQYMKDYQGKYLKRIADDTGNPRYIKKINDNIYKLDVYCPRLPNETDEKYKK